MARSEPGSPSEAGCARPGQPGKRGFEHMVACYEAGLMTRIAMDTFQFSPPLIATRAQLEEIFARFKQVVRAMG